MAKRSSCLLIGLMFIATACKKGADSSGSSSSVGAIDYSAPDQASARRIAAIRAAKLPTAEEKSLLGVVEQLQYDDAQEVIDRRELVVPRPSNFKPESAKRKISLRLIVEKTILRRGEHPRFRLELMNIGQEPIYYQERPQSFFKSCNLSTPLDHLDFVMKGPSGKEEGLRAPIALGDEMVLDEIKFPAGWTESQKAEWARKRNLQIHAQDHLALHLNPGETLRTRGDGPDDAFCTMRTDTHFDVPGTYSIHVKFDDTPPPLTESDIRMVEKAGVPRDRQLREHDLIVTSALGRSLSNDIQIEVAP